MTQNENIKICEFADKIHEFQLKYYCKKDKNECIYSLKVTGFNEDEGIFCMNEYETFTKRDGALN